jgi:branched-chain amino acid transport system ATP-binding protein
VLARGQVLAEGDYATVSRKEVRAVSRLYREAVIATTALKPTSRCLHCPLLKVRGLEAWYGESHALHGIDFDVAPGEVVTLLGRNGAGKTTTLRAIMGVIGRRKGSSRFEGKETDRLRVATRSPGSASASCPEERGIFASLDVEENLMLPPVVRPGGSRSRSSRSSPTSRSALRSQGTKLSGGEQQMLAIGRILRTGARLLLLDEPTEGLAPVIVAADRPHHRELKQRGFTVLLVEQNFRFAQTVADRHYVIEHGKVMDMMPNAELDLANIDKLHLSRRLNRAPITGEKSSIVRHPQRENDHEADAATTAPVP